jgi:Transglycosylase SLT domain
MAKAMGVAGFLIGVLATSLGGAALGVHSQSDQVEAAAAEAGVDPQDLRGALNSQGVRGMTTDPWVYLRSNRELPDKTLQPPAVSPPAPASGVSARVACIIRVESRGDPNARNRSGASGLGQFLSGTWASTPQGRAGYSVFNAAANTAAIQWMIDVGRAREFDAVRFYGC